MIVRNYNVELIERPNDVLGAYEYAEIGARICYKSENAIQYDENGRSLTAKPFVEKLINVNKHKSIAEHGTIYLRIPKFAKLDIDKYRENKFSYVSSNVNWAYITTNLRVLYENDWLDDIDKYSCEQTACHVPRLVFRFTTQCIISREANRHRSHSPSEQSTRYCNYSKGKFGGEVSISIPEFAKGCSQLDVYKEIGPSMLRSYCSSIASNPSNPELFNDKFDYWMFGNLASEYAYLGMLNHGAIPDEARTVLPLDTNTELVHTAYVWDWFNFCKLRCAPNAHKDIQPLANIVKDALISKGYFTEEEFENTENGWDLVKF